MGGSEWRPKRSTTAGGNEKKKKEEFCHWFVESVMRGVADEKRFGRTKKKTQTRAAKNHQSHPTEPRSSILIRRGEKKRSLDAVSDAATCNCASAGKTWKESQMNNSLRTSIRAGGGDGEKKKKKKATCG